MVSKFLPSLSPAPAVVGAKAAVLEEVHLSFPCPFLMARENVFALVVDNGSCKRSTETEGGFPWEHGPRAGCLIPTNSNLLPAERVTLMESDISVRRQNHYVPEGESARKKFLVTDGNCLIAVFLVFEVVLANDEGGSKV